MIDDFIDNISSKNNREKIKEKTMKCVIAIVLQSIWYDG